MPIFGSSSSINASGYGFLGAKERMIASLQKTEVNPIWLARNAPLVDFLDPTIKVKQVLVETAQDDLYFQKVPKVDRCMTCHVFIDKQGYEDQPQPYKTHPKLESLAVGMNSPHPMKKFGCTSCHGGEGHRVTDFSAPVHMPENMVLEPQSRLTGIVFLKFHPWRNNRKSDRAKKFFPLTNS